MAICLGCLFFFFAIMALRIQQKVRIFSTGAYEYVDVCYYFWVKISTVCIFFLTVSYEYIEVVYEYVDVVCYLLG